MEGLDAYLRTLGVALVSQGNVLHLVRENTATDPSEGEGGTLVA